MGIINGTTNYILTKMSQEGADYADALADAQALGYAEVDPTADVEGYDAGAKAAIIVDVFGVDVRSSDVQHEGISSITAADIDTAKRLGYVIKALAVIERADGEVASGMGGPPAIHSRTSTTRSTLFVYATVGDLMFYGRVRVVVQLPPPSSASRRRRRQRGQRCCGPAVDHRKRGCVRSTNSRRSPGRPGLDELACPPRWRRSSASGVSIQVWSSRGPVVTPSCASSCTRPPRPPSATESSMV